MGIEYFTDEGVTVVRVRGSLNHASADALREGVYAVLRQRQRTVFVNLDNVPGIDAAGLGALAHVHQMALIVGAAVTLTNIRPRVRYLLDLAGLSACFDVAGSESEALEDLELWYQCDQRNRGKQDQEVERLMSIDAPDRIHHGVPPSRLSAPR